MKTPLDTIKYCSTREQAEQIQQEIDEMEEEQFLNKTLDELITDILVTCFEGGSNYWISEAVLHTLGYKDGVAVNNIYTTIQNNGVIRIYEDDGAYHELVKAKMVNGILRHCRTLNITLEDFKTDYDWDATDADCCLQYALFDHIVYG